MPLYTEPRPALNEKISVLVDEFEQEIKQKTDINKKKGKYLEDFFISTSSNTHRLYGTELSPHNLWVEILFLAVWIETAEVNQVLTIVNPSE